ncbi:MAG: NAD-dependent epimerase/dehydratase family protein [Litorimonas sp.]
MKIALTGATGFLGLHLLTALLEAGHNVNVLVRSPDKLPQNIRAQRNLSIFEGDLQSDLTDWAKGADCVIHLAGLIKARTLAEFISVNADGAGRIANAAQSAKVSRFILFSSMAAREPHLSGYAASKHAGERAVKTAFTDGALVIIRAPAVFGPNDMATKPIFQMLQKGWFPVVGGDWKKTNISMVYIDDLIKNLVSNVIHGGCDGRIVSPSSITKMSWAEFANFAALALNRPVRVLPIPVIIMKPIAAITSVTLRLFGVGHLSLEKLREFRHPDWTSPDEIDNPTPMIEALRITATSYKKD